ncbi:helix-turn-helix domain-containing protein [Blautia obeum]|uniref:helix-turn-helix domain-containing protein n=1 Tax=Blautia obeum TaxID=40520 RepID=UPI003D00F02B
MNEQYLMQYISYHLHTFVRKYSNTGDLASSFCARIEFDDAPIGNEIFQTFFSVCKDLTKPVYLTVNNQITYACTTVQDGYFVIGPVRFTSTVYLKHHITNEQWNLSWIATVPFCEFSDLTKDILLTYNLCHSDIIDENVLLMSNCINLDAEKEIRKYYSELIFENREYGKTHNPYDQEIREFTSIENGDLEQLKRSHEEDYPGEIGTLAKDPLRHTKNLAIVNITLASRAAIRGGLLSEISFSLSDSYIQKIEACEDIPTIIHLFRTAEYHYAQMVHDLNSEKAGTAEKDTNPHINKCKDYVFSHLHGKITVQEIADELCLNANYLSELFKKCEHISLTKFIQKEKISLAKNLLIYSHYSYIEIATYLGYSSQSHLGKQFKEETGYTMRKYRETYGMKDFIW